MDARATMVPLPAAPGTWVQAIALDGERAAVLCGDAVVTANLRDPDSWAVLCPGAAGVALHGERVYTRQGEEVVAIDARTGRRVAAFGPADPVPHGLALSRDGRRLAIGGYRHVSVWDTGTARREARWRAHRRIVPRLAFSADGAVLATHSFEDLARWRVRGPLRIPARASTGSGGTSDVAFLPDGRLVASAAEGTVGVFGARLGRPQRLTGLRSWIRSVAASAPGDRIAASDMDGGVRMWSWPAGDPVLEGAVTGYARGLAFTDDGTLVAGDDAALTIWDDRVPAPALDRLLPAHDPFLDAADAPPSRLPWDALTLDAIEAAARNVPWLERLGAPAALDAEVHRLRDWDGWPGPEDRQSEALHQATMRFDHAIERAVRALGRPAVSEQRERATELVRARARATVPYDDDADPWDARWSAVHEAAWTAGLVAAYAAFGRPVPRDLRTLWAWFEAGHWPCGVRAGRLVVL